MQLGADDRPFGPFLAQRVEYAAFAPASAPQWLVIDLRRAQPFLFGIELGARAPRALAADDRHLTGVDEIRSLAQPCFTIAGVLRIEFDPLDRHQCFVVLPLLLSCARIRDK